ncbi:MAG: ATP-binding protein [Armatimonadetes bacterium]|nr:ATP-binding protein [Armatimonadota bacterium]
MVLTPLEDRAVAALQVVAPEIERVAVQGMHDIERELPEPIQSLVREAPVPAGSFRVRLAGHPRPVPLRSLGEGVSRLLGISLEMTQVQGGLLLIDEFENGLHHTIQAEVWSHLLAIARELDVQVVATTHSYDAVVAFQETIRKHPDEGLLIRLQRAGDVCRATTFTGEELQIVAREQIEVR